jgi:putative endonuclease
LDRNIRWGNKEIDIVADDVESEEIVFIEVKTRSQDMFGSVRSAVGFKKRCNLRAAAVAYLKEKKVYKDFRFDVISIVGGKIEHFENITW